MIWQDLPPSNYVEDCRVQFCTTKRPVTTINDMIEEILERRKTQDLARALGADDIGGR